MGAIMSGLLAIVGALLLRFNGYMADRFRARPGAIQGRTLNRIGVALIGLAFVVVGVLGVVVSVS